MTAIQIAGCLLIWMILMHFIIWILQEIPTLLLLFRFIQDILFSMSFAMCIMIGIQYFFSIPIIVFIIMDIVLTLMILGEVFILKLKYPFDKGYLFSKILNTIYFGIDTILFAWVSYFYLIPEKTITWTLFCIMIPMFISYLINYAFEQKQRTMLGQL